MYRKIITLDDEKTLVIEWQESWKNLVLKMENNILGSVDTKEELKAGRTFRLPNGKSCMVVLSDNGLEVWYEGVEMVSGTKSGSTDFFGSSFRAMMTVGTVNLVLGNFLRMAGDTPEHLNYCAALISFGFALLVLGIYTRKKNTKSTFILGFIFGGLSLAVSILLTSYIGSGAALYLIVTLTMGFKSKEYQPTTKISIDQNEPLDSSL